METQIVNNYEYQGLGVPVKLKQVKFVKIRGDWYPKIDVEQVASELFESLLKKARTTLLSSASGGHAIYNPSAGELHIPLIDVPGVFGGTQTYEVYLKRPPNTFTFDLDMGRIVLK